MGSYQVYEEKKPSQWVETQSINGENGRGGGRSHKEGEEEDTKP